MMIQRLIWNHMFHILGLELCAVLLHENILSLKKVSMYTIIKNIFKKIYIFFFWLLFQYHPSHHKMLVIKYALATA